MARVPEEPRLNDDKSPLIDLLSCFVCKETMKIEKSVPDSEGCDITQYRCQRCARIERVLPPQSLAPASKLNRCPAAGHYRVPRTSLRGTHWQSKWNSEGGRRVSSVQEQKRLLFRLSAARVKQGRSYGRHQRKGKQCERHIHFQCS